MSDSIANIMNEQEKLNYQELFDPTNEIKTCLSNYIRVKLLYETIHICLKDEQISTELKMKIHNILTATEVEGCMDLELNNNQFKLLGLRKLNVAELSHEEQSKFRASLENMLIKESNKTERLSSLPTEDDKMDMDLKKKLENTQKLYIENLLMHYNLLEEILLLRTKDVKESATLKVDECSLQMRLYKLRMQIVKEKARVDMFTETSVALDAYRELIKDIITQQDQCNEDIEQLRTLKEKYRQVSCKEYDEILKSYIAYKRDLEIKKSLFKRIKGQ